MLSNIRLIEIEIHSYCNRKCNWCPNKFIDRDFYEQLPEDIYLKILNELKENNFNSIITYSRYNEPMYNIDLLNKRIKQAKEILPEIKLVFNTNGDYLTKENLNKISPYLDELSIMDYDCKGYKKCKNKMNLLNINNIKYENNFLYGKYKNMDIIYYLNWPKNHEIEDRGGLLQKIQEVNFKNNKQLRKKICLEPRYFIGIDYNGNITPCCHIRSDHNKHKEYILGNVKQQSLVDIYHSNKAKKIRESAKKGSFKRHNLEPCLYCQKDPGRYTCDNPGIEYNKKKDD
jgi:radical SAM protein with 4Fe4S-binding SPASM domain